MKPILAGLLLALFSPGAGVFAQENASAIIRAMDANLTFDEGIMKITMTDFKASGSTREFKMDIRYKKGAGTLMEFTAPARERGKKVLLSGNNMWMYAPGLSRPVRMSGRDSFMGTSFSNRDLMDYEMDKDYDSRIISETAERYLIESRAVNRNVSYPKIVIAVDKSVLLPIRQELYAISGNLIKTMDFSDVRNYGGKKRPAEIKITDVLSKGDYTVVKMDEMSEKIIDERVFLPQNMAR